VSAVGKYGELRSRETATRLVTPSFIVFSIVSGAGQAATAGWPDTVDLLVQERSQAAACVDLLKSIGDRQTIARGRIIYGEAKAAADGVIAGFTTALVEGYSPKDLPRIQANLDRAGAGLQEVCDAGVAAAGRGRDKRHC